jgi:hypothetical protein
MTEERPTKNSGTFMIPLYTGGYLQIDYYSLTVRYTKNNTMYYVCQFSEEETGPNTWNELVVDNQIIKINFWNFNNYQLYPQSEYYYDKNKAIKKEEIKKIVKEEIQQQPFYSSVVSSGFTSVNPFITQPAPIPVKKDESPEIYEVKAPEKPKPKIYIRPDAEMSPKFR